MRIFYIVLLTLSLLISCTGQKKLQFKKFDALLGSWERIESNSLFVENWYKINNRHYKGHSVEIVKGDTVFTESVDLIKKDNGIYYIVSFPGTDFAAVPFRMISKNPWTFENKKNDFPQRIIYQHPSRDSLTAHIEGEVEGKFQKIDFKMKRAAQKQR